LLITDMPKDAQTLSSLFVDGLQLLLPKKLLLLT
jgi:hypothetical protein